MEYYDNESDSLSEDESIAFKSLLDNSLGEIFIGTNEEFIFGYNLVLSEQGDSVDIEQTFSNHSHCGRIKKMAILNQYLATGGTDEHIKIFNLDSRLEVGHIDSHDGTVTCLSFHKSGFLFSAAEDGKIAIHKAPRWILKKELCNHTLPISGLAIHPSGKMAISVAKDKKKIIWDLIKGKRAYVAGLKNVPDVIEWSPTGSYYVIASGKVLSAYNIETGSITHSFDFEDPINTILFISEDLILIGGENKHISLCNIATKSIEMNWKAHDNRLKSLVTIDSNSEKDFVIVASASSDGFIKIWKIDIVLTSNEPKLLGEIDTSSRIICMAVRSNATHGQPWSYVAPPVIDSVSTNGNSANERKRKRKAIPADEKGNAIEPEETIPKKKLTLSKNNKVQNVNKKLNSKFDSKKVDKDNIQKIKVTPMEKVKVTPTQKVKVTPALKVKVTPAQKVKVTPAQKVKVNEAAVSKQKSSMSKNKANMINHSPSAFDGYYDDEHDEQPSKVKGSVLGLPKIQTDNSKLKKKKKPSKNFELNESKNSKLNGKKVKTKSLQQDKKKTKKVFKKKTKIVKRKKRNTGSINSKYVY